MKTEKLWMAVLGLIGGVALGVWIGAAMTAGDTAPDPGDAAQIVEAPAEAAAATPKRVARVSRVKPADVVGETTPDTAPRLVMTIPVSAPELHDRMRPLLARGTKMSMALEGFTNAEQFATIAHAARNTQVPFILLKHRVLTGGQSLEDAIRASKPELDARMEVERARAAAREDLAALSATD